MSQSLSSIICESLAQIAESSKITISHEDSLKHSPENIIDKLYSLQHVVLTIYRGLSSHAQYMIYKVLMNNNVALLNLTDFMKDGTLDTDYKLGFDQLNALYLTIYYEKNTYLLRESFCQNLSSFLFSNPSILPSESSTGNFTLIDPSMNSTTNNNHSIGMNNLSTISNDLSSESNIFKIYKDSDSQFLQDYAEKRWNSILDFITQSYFNDSESDTTLCTTQEIYQVLLFASNFLLLLSYLSYRCDRRKRKFIK